MSSSSWGCTTVSSMYIGDEEEEEEELETHMSWVFTGFRARKICQGHLLAAPSASVSSAAAAVAVPDKEDVANASASAHWHDLKELGVIPLFLG